MKITILHIEDQALVRYSLEKSLKANDDFLNYFELIGAENGKVGITKFEANQNINIMIIDVNMPEMGGLEMLDYLVEKYPERMDKTQIIFVTAHDPLEIASSIGNYDIYSWLVKPVDFNKLLTYILKNMTE